MKKLTLILSAILLSILVPATTFAGETTALTSVQLVGGNCGGLVTINVHYTTAGGPQRIEAKITGNGVTVSNFRNISGLPGTGTETFQLDTSEVVISGVVLRVWAKIAGQWHVYYFDCENFEFVDRDIIANPNSYRELARNTSYEFNVAGNDWSDLPFSFVRLLYQPASGEASMASGSLTVQLMTADQLGSFSFEYEICNIANWCDTASISFSVTNQAPNCEAASENPTYYWPPNHQMESIVDVSGVTDPDGDPITITIDSITAEELDGNTSSTLSDDDIDFENGLIRVERSGGGTGRIYYINFTATDSPPAPGVSKTCTGAALIIIPHDAADIPLDANVILTTGSSLSNPNSDTSADTSVASDTSTGDESGTSTTDAATTTGVTSESDTSTSEDDVSTSSHPSNNGNAYAYGQGNGNAYGHENGNNGNNTSE